MAPIFVLVCGLGSLAILLLRGAQRDWATGDTYDLIKGAATISDCLQGGILVHCSQHEASSGLPFVSKFALIQQLPAFLLGLTGLSLKPTDNLLTWLNSAAVTGLVGSTLRWAHRRAGLPLAVIAGLLMIPGMLLTYANQSFAEPLATAAFGGLVLAALRVDRSSPWLIFAAWLATDSKETAAPFVVVFGLAALLLSGADLAVVKSAGGKILIGVAGGLILQALFNIFRYGTLLNHVYLDEPRSSLSMIPSNGLGMLIAPDAGILFFWPGVAIAVVVLIKAAIRPGLRLGQDARRIRVGAILALAGLGATVLSLADWWSSFGWYAWGPRLLLPTAGSILILGLAVIARQDLTRFWLSRSRSLLLGLIAAISVVISMAPVYTPDAIMAQLAPSAQESLACSATQPTQAQRDECTTLQTWRLTHTPWQEAVRLSAGSSTYWIDAGLGVLSLWTWAALARRGLRVRGKVPAHRL